MSGQVEKNSTLGLAFATVEELSEELAAARKRGDELEWAIQKACAQLPEDPRRALSTLLGVLPT